MEPKRRAVLSKDKLQRLRVWQKGGAYILDISASSQRACAGSPYGHNFLFLSASKNDVQKVQRDSSCITYSTAANVKKQAARHSALHLVLEMDPRHEGARLFGKALLMGLDVCLQGVRVPGGVGDERHEGVGPVHVAPVHPPDPVELDLQVTKCMES